MQEKNFTPFVSEIDKSQVDSMFNRIAKRYDFLNHFLSFGIDRYWRKKLAKNITPKQTFEYLDIASGTGDQLFTVCNHYNNSISRAVGVDIAIEMLAIAKKKQKNRKLTKRISFLHESVYTLPFPDQSFDIATISFGIRNISEIEQGLREILRVLKPGGELLILEFSLPKNLVLRKLHLFYLRYILPFIGKCFSKDPKAYSYLGKTIEEFPHGQHFCKIMEECGFSKATPIPLTFGIASIYKAIR